MNKIDQQTNRVRWEEHVSAWRKSGMSQSAYSREHGLLPKLFSAWVGRVRRSESTELTKPLTVVPVRVSGLGAQSTVSSALSLQHARGWTLQLPGNISPSSLGQILRELS
jgi:hypothetical protein